MKKIYKGYRKGAWGLMTAAILTSTVPQFSSGAPQRTIVASTGSQRHEGESAFTSHLTDLWRGFGEIAKSPGWTPQQDQAYISRIEESITGYVIERLNSRPAPSADLLEGELDRATTKAFDGLSFEVMKQQNPDWQGFAQVLQSSGPGPLLYVVAVTIGPGNTPWNLLKAFSSRRGVYESVASVGGDFKNRRLRLLELKPFEPEELRFLVSGLYVGSPEALTRIVLYSFNGERLKIIWQKDSVPNAQISLNGANLAVTSYDSVAGKRPWVSTVESYTQVITGLKLTKVQHGTVQ